MSYRTTRSMVLMGRSFKRNDVVPEPVLTEIPSGRLRSLKSTGLLREVEFEPESPPVESSTDQDETSAEDSARTEGETCPECGAGPFKRLDRHMTTHQGA